jgi:hypothetical protein
LLTLSGCNIVNPEEKIPSYIHIDAIEVNTDYTTQGASTSNITDAWVYINDQFVGGYELPATFPVLFEGEVEIKVSAGIKNSGASALRVDYSFYDFYTIKTKLHPDSIHVIKPKVTYYTNIDFEWLENFDAPTSSLSPTAESVALQTTTDSIEKLTGTGSAKISILDTSQFFYALSPKLDIPILGNNVYLEMDYKSTGYVEVRLITYLPGEVKETAIIILYPKANWNKIYIDLGSDISTYPNALEHQIAIACYNLKGSQSSVTYLDNLKIIHPG